MDGFATSEMIPSEHKMSKRRLFNIKYVFKHLLNIFVSFFSTSFAHRVQNAQIKSTQLMPWWHRANITHTMGVDVIDLTVEGGKRRGKKSTNIESLVY